jgi:hypothetical protein
VLKQGHVIFLSYKIWRANSFIIYRTTSNLVIFPTDYNYFHTTFRSAVADSNSGIKWVTCNLVRIWSQEMLS